MGFLSDPFVIKNLTFGIEDSIISTSGVLLGVNAANLSRQEILITGFILVLVESLSMSYGTFISDEAFSKTEGTSKTTIDVFYYALVMFLSYFLIGMILLSPFYFNLKNPSVYVIAIALSLLAFIIYFNEKNLQKVKPKMNFRKVKISLSLFGQPTQKEKNGRKTLVQKCKFLKDNRKICRKNSNQKFGP